MAGYVLSWNFWKVSTKTLTLPQILIFKMLLKTCSFLLQQTNLVLSPWSKRNLRKAQSIYLEVIGIPSWDNTWLRTFQYGSHRGENIHIFSWSRLSHSSHYPPPFPKILVSSESTGLGSTAQESKENWKCLSWCYPVVGKIHTLILFNWSPISQLLETHREVCQPAACFLFPPRDRTRTKNSTCSFPPLDSLPVP